MNKLELIQALKNNNDLTTDEAKSVVNIFFNEISETLAKDERVEIRGLCSLYVKKYKSYTGGTDAQAHSPKHERVKLFLTEPLISYLSFQISDYTINKHYWIKIENNKY